VEAAPLDKAIRAKGNRFKSAATTVLMGVRANKFIRADADEREKMKSALCSVM